jgi:hypothetical protein
MNKFLYKLALKSYTIVSITFIVNFVTVFFIRFFIDPIPLIVTASFFLITGIYVGYVISYYVIKYLKDEEIKKKLPLN